MAIFINEAKNLQSIPRTLVFDSTMSDRARFVYVYMACKPDGWEFFLKPMAKEIGYSVDTLRKYITELIEHGWLVKGCQRNDNGVFGAVEYTLKVTKITDTENFRHGKNPTLDNIDIGINNKDIFINNLDYNNNSNIIPSITDSSIVIDKNSHTNKLKEKKIEKENLKEKDIPTLFAAESDPPKKGNNQLDLSAAPNDEFKAVINEWLAYKRERRQTYKQRGVNTFIKQLVKFSSGNVTTARKIIEQSMANNWAGIFPLKENKDKYMKLDAEALEEIKTFTKQQKEKGEMTVW